MRFFGARHKPEEPQAKKVGDFLQALSALAPAAKGQHKFPDHVDATKDGGIVQFKVRSGRSVAIHRIWTPLPGKGHGTHMLKTLCRLADAHGVELTLKVLPFGQEPYPLSTAKLTEWYQRHGFVGTQKKMIRKPHTNHPT